MAVVNTLSTTSTPITHPQTADNMTGQRPKQVRQKIAITNGDSIGSVYLIGQVPDNAVIINITLDAATIAGISACDIGLYDMAGNAKITTTYSDFYASGLDLTSSSGLAAGKFTNTFQRNAATNRAAPVATDPVWKNAGDSEGPAGTVVSGTTIKGPKYQVGLSLRSAATASGTVIADISYTVAE